MATTDIRITVPDELREAMESAARAEGRTVDEFAVTAFKREIARRFLANIKRDAEARRQGKSDEEIEEIVDRAVHEVRDEARGR